MRHAAFAALVLFGAVPSLVDAQVTAAGAHAPTVIQTANGITQVNINRPSGAGVSQNTYSRFDVPKAGVILNNSPTIVQTQQAGQINGNANLLPGQSARIILNQVNSNSPSQLRGFVEVAGSKAEVVVANGSGIVVDGGGFINTTRGILTTGSPILDASGNLNGFNVTGGNILVQGAGLNAANVDQVDLIARAVQANAAIYANNLNVVTGANQVNHDTLSATPIAGDGSAPGVSIDVSQLGGMYANRITLVGTENGVGVSNAGVIAAQAGDLTLTTQGKLVLTGKTNASGNLAVFAHDGIDNGGTTYGQQGVSVGTAGDLVNSGTLAAQQGLTAVAGNIASTGTLGAGINSDGSIAQTGDLSVSATGLLSATGRNAAGGNATLRGGSIDLSGSTTSAKGNLMLNASGGDLNLSGATTTADSTVNATASGTLTNDNAVLSSGGAQTITAGALSNRSGQIVSGDTLTANVAGAASNQGGTMQAAGALTAHAGSLDNTAGHIASLNADGLAFSTVGLLNNGVAGTIGSNGSVTVQAGQIANAGSITAAQTLITTAVQMLVNGGTLAANGNVNAAAGATLSTSGTISAGQNATLSAATLDNSAGSISADQLVLSAANLVNHGGTITQTGTGATTIAVSGTLDNANGSLQTNAANLTLGPATLVNDHGMIANSGNGTLSVNTGSLSNNGGTLATNGALSIEGGAVSNRGGRLAGQSSAVLKLASLDNSAGGYVGAQNVTVTDAGALDNADGTIQANDGLAVSAQSVANDGGTIANGGASATTVSASGTLTNTGNGVIGGNGDVFVTGGSVDNSSGTVVAGGAASVQSGSTLGNRAGMIQGNGAAIASAQGAIDNTGGQIGANGPTSTLTVAGTSLDNTDGRIANIGNGATTVDAATVTNSNAGGVSGAGTIGGNGDVTVNAQMLSNTHGAQIVSGHDLALNVAQSVDNTGASLSGAYNLTLDQAGAAIVNQNGSIHANGVLGLNVATLDNTSGRIGNDAGSGGSVAITAGTLANQGGAIGSDQNLSVTTNRLTGDGRIVAGNDGAVTLDGDYTLGTANLIQANHDLSFTTTGSFTNQGALGAVNALTLNATNVDNQAGADLNSTSTTVNAANAITNEGRIEGEHVTTNSATLTNTATIIGNTVTLNGSRSIANIGAAAIMAAASQLNLYSPGDISNTGGANLFSLGDINIAADATRDAGGLLANRSNSVTNDQSTIEAQSDIEVATQTLTNSRPAPTVDTVTTDVSSLHQTKRSQYIACTPSNGDGNAGCGDSVWSGPYKTPLTATYAAPDVVSETSGANATDRALVVSVNGVQQTIWYNTATTNPDGSVTVTYWDGYDPNINYDPATEYPVRSDGHNGYQRVEIARDTTMTTQQDQVTAQAQQAELLAGGNLTLANVGTLNNNYSAIAAGSSIQIGSTTQDSTLDPSASGSFGGTQVNNVGQTLYQYQRQDIVSTYAWNENPTQDVGQVAEPSVVLAPVAIGGTGGTIVANNTVLISAADINNTNVAAANSATGATGGTLGANGVVGGVTGGGAQTVNLATGETQTINAPQSVASPTGTLKITLPTSGLYTYQAAPGASYLVVTDPRLTSYTSFISSDYMLKQLGLNPQSVEKRLGDGMYEEQLVRDQITQLTGRVYLQGYTNNLDEYQALMTNGVNVAQQFGLEPGIALTAAQMDALTSDIVWLVSQTVMLPDGSTQQVLAPVVYLAQTHANDLQPTGALISADDVEIHATGSAVNSGVIKGGTQTVVSATDILNRGGTIASSSANGTTVLSATNNVVNASGTISGNRVAVLAGNNIVNTTLVDTVGVSGAAGDSKVSQTLLGAQGTIASTGDMVIAAGNDLMVHGANMSAGGSAQITAAHDITVDAVQSATSQSVTKNDQHHWEENSTTNQTSAISAGGDLAIQSGNDATFRGAKVTSGGDMVVVAGGDLTATTVTNTVKYDNVATDGSSRKEVDHTYDEQAVGTSFKAGGNATLGAVSSDASKGNVMLTGSSLTAGMTNGVDNGAGTASIAATGSVTIGEAREEHDNYQAVESKRGSFVSGSTTYTMQDTHANVAVGSLVSGDTVDIQTSKDLTVQGSTVAGTNDVNLAAAGNVNIATSQDTATKDSYYYQKKSGFMSTGSVGFSVGTATQTDTSQTTTVTNNGSLVGSINGNLNVTAGKDLHVTGSDLVAGGNITGTGANVTIDAATNTSHTEQTQETKKSGFTLALSGSVGDAINGAIAEAQAVSSSSGNSRAQALHAIAAVGDSAIAVASLTGGALGGPSPSIAVQLSYGSSQSKSTFTEDQSTHSGSTVQAGGTATFVATGDGTAGSGNVTVVGSNLSANDVLLAAKNQVNLVNTTDTDTTASTNKSSSASVGVSYGTNGFGVSASMSNAHGDGNSDAAIQSNTHVTGANSVTILSGGDTNFVGSDVSGGTVTANVGGNLNIQSVQDTTVSTAHQSSSGGGFSISQGGGSASFSAQNGHADANYAGVNEQAGIHAGDGGFNLNVDGNTSLMGAVIDSTADASKNSLTTGMLTFSDVQNQSYYSAASNGLSAGAGVGTTGKAIGTGSVGGAGGVVPMISQDENGDESATTRSAVSAGAINITNQAAQTQNVASLSRDTTNTNGTVSSAPDINNLLSQQADTMQAAQAAGQVIAQGIGAYADQKQQQAQQEADAAKAANLPDVAAQYQAEADSWDEGGTDRTALHIAGGALIGGLGGGSAFGAVGGAAGAYVASSAAKGLADIAKGVDSATGSQLIGNLAANVVAGLGGALVGGTAGAASASNVHLYNQSMDDERQLTGESRSSSPFSQSPLDLILQGIANGLGAVFGMPGEPPTTGTQGVLVNSPSAPPLVTGGNTSGYVPGNAIFNSGNSDAGDARQANPSKADSPVWQGLDSAGNGVKTDGKLFYEWDYTHNDIEVYNKRGVHLGSMDPVSGDMYKDAVPGRKLNNR